MTGQIDLANTSIREALPGDIFFGFSLSEVPKVVQEEFQVQGPRKGPNDNSGSIEICPLMGPTGSGVFIPDYTVLIPLNIGSERDDTMYTLGGDVNRTQRGCQPSHGMIDVSHSVTQDYYERATALYFKNTGQSPIRVSVYTSRDGDIDSFGYPDYEPVLHYDDDLGEIATVEILVSQGQTLEWGPTNRRGRDKYRRFFIVTAPVDGGDEIKYKIQSKELYI